MNKRIVNLLVIGLCVILVTGPSLSLAAPADAKKRAEEFLLKSKSSYKSKETKRPNLHTTRRANATVGQTTTELPDGRSLVIGGQGEDGPSADVLIRNPRTSETDTVPAGLHEARAWHSATMLPNGQVLIVGGIGASGQVLSSAEIFDPETQTFELLPAAAGFAKRAYHTATLLTDGQVLLAGGVSEGGRASSRTQLWDFRTKSSIKQTSALSAARQKHRASLLPDGNVLLEGGVDDNGKDLPSADLYNSETRDFYFTTLTAGQNESATPFLTGSVPRDGAIDVAIDNSAALRFSKRLRVETVNNRTVKLVGTEGTITTKIVPAEDGRLAFITPIGSLLSGATYTLTIAGAADGANEITAGSVTFTTKRKQEDSNQSPPVGDADWIPSQDNFGGNWKSKSEKSEWQELAPLEAAPGATALAGQALTLNGQPLRDVTLRVANATTRTDNSGRFLLSSINPGHQVLVIDGRTASTRGKVYGTFRAGVEVTEKKTNVLPFTIWMPRLDMAHSVSVSSPTTREVVITNPLIPGLELHLPPGTAIRDLDGQAVTQISITPVPTDRPPFPLPPGFNVPVFASIQPGGARIIPPRAQLIYPNYTNELPGARINFWNYDPEGKGWYIYGQGTVSQNGKQIIPDAGVVIYEFTGIMISSGGSPPSLWPLLDALLGDPVDLSTGLFVYNKTDLILPDVLPIVLTRTYRPGDSASRAFGIGSTHPYEMFLWSVNNYQQADLILPDGGRIHYVRISPGTSYWDAVYEHTATPSAFYKSRISWNGNGWDLKLKDGTVFVFPDMSPLKSIRDRYGNQLTITRSTGNYGNITQLTSPNGRWVQFSYDTSNRVTQARDNIGRTVNYTYDSGGRLWKVTDPAGGVTEYTYDTSSRMLTIKDARGIVYLTNQYDSSGRVIRQTQADNSTFQFAYTLDAGGKITQADVTDPRGYVRRVTFNSSGYTLTHTKAVGRPEQQTITVERQAGSNFPLSVTDALNRKTAYTYDSMGNPATITNLADTSEAVTTTVAYEPLYNEPGSVTDPLNHITTFAYDSSGHMTSVNDPLNHQISFTYNTSGQIVSMTNPTGNTTQWTYTSGDLSSITNPLGNTTSRFVDAVGRPISTTDALGRVRRYTYNSLNQILQETDPLGGNTSFSYDQNGNLLSVTDARGNLTSYIYDVMDRLVSRKDPLLREETYQYDTNGNVTQVTDRKGQVTTYAYDALDRLTSVTYADSSITNFVYDSGDRLTQAVDSIAGTIAFTYDNLDRLTSEATPQGALSYSYDSAGRRTSMTVAGQPTVSYSYDAADRLIGISQGQSSVTYAYDAADRRINQSLPNGVAVDYGYDVGSNLTSITYRHGSDVLGNLTYEYDAGRQRKKVAGSFARTALPQAFQSATYDAANQITQRGTSTLSHDANGNLLSDGVNSYNWDARNRLTGISGNASASFQYDAFGRRTSSSANSQSTQYLYDGEDVIQELAAGVPTANMLNGLGVDERHTCNCNGSSSSLLTDGLGSALALTDSSGAVQTQYTYDPFGSTSNSGTFSTNASQYTGRENDGTGLYFYRARYYSPTLQRFIGEDPLGFGGGDVNLYAYVGNSPTNFSDPRGMFLVPIAAACLEGALINAAIDSALDALAGRKTTLSGLGRSALMGCGLGIVGLGLGKVLGIILRSAAEGGPNLVYQSVNALGDVNYVGITNNLERRAAEQLGKKGIGIEAIPGLQNLSRADARAVEQVLIENHGLGREGGTLLNKINSIAESNPAYADAIRRGRELLRRAGYPGF